jgi:1-aminocyclopropane-1-carboxylate deaminase/D-cysteine desulfhydrase-like pyridoxal-dependent ACC family enzyme
VLLTPAPLLQAFPCGIPWRALVRRPTPVQHVGALGGAAIWVKRDDKAGLPYGGNKVRKLEFLLAAALEGGSRAIVTTGGTGSHHVLACGIHGRAAGLDVHAVTFPQPMTEHSEAVSRATAAWGVRRWPVASKLTLPLTVRRALRAASPASLIAPGGSWGAGVLGYADAAFELAEQVRSGACPKPDLVVVPSGTGGTHAGLLLGLALAGLGDIQVQGVAVVDKVFCNAPLTAAAARSGAQALRREGVALPRTRVTAADVRLDRGFLGPGYAHITPEATEALATGKDLGITLDTTYSAKAFAWLLAAARSGALGGRTVMFWLTYDDRVPLPSSP